MMLSENTQDNGWGCGLDDPFMEVTFQIRKAWTGNLFKKKKKKINALKIQAFGQCEQVSQDPNSATGTWTKIAALKG